MRNLLLQLQYKREEDFWTEAFAHLLEHLVMLDYKYAQELFLNLSNGIFDLSSYCSNDLKIRTQSRIQKGITDIEIITPDFCVVIENKVEAGLGYGQTEKYIEHLKNHFDSFLVIVLSKYPTYWEEPENVVSARWFEVYQYLEKISIEPLSPESHLLLKQFLEFLKAKGQSVDGAKEGLADSISFLLEQKNYVYHSQIKSFDTLRTVPELNPFYDFWTLVRKAIKNVRPQTKVKLGSGKTGHTGSAWIALNFDNADIFCTVYFNEPHQLIFETYKRKIDADRMRSMENWDIFANNRKCQKALKLREVDFFYCSESGQLKMLEEFFQNCYAELGE